MEYDKEDIAMLYLQTGGTFRSAGHYPLLAGYTKDGEPLYLESSEDISIPENVQPENIKIKENYADHDGSKVGPVQNPGGVTACDSHVLVQILAKCGENRVSHGLEHFSKQSCGSSDASGVPIFSFEAQLNGHR